MRLAVIDCGTNTFNILIVDTQQNGKYTRVFNTRIPVKLGEGSINKGFIGVEPFKRGINALCDFGKIAQDYEVFKVLAFATSAIRDAKNSEAFVEEARKTAGVEINVIDGNREAELIYLGNREAVKLGNEVSLIMDIGGGSTEFILANQHQIFWKYSFNLGAARLIQKFNPSSPILEEEITEINNYLKESLNTVYEAVKNFPPHELIGSSGAFDSVVEMIHGELNGEAIHEKKTSYEINLDNFHHISNLVKISTLEERKHIKGLTPMRFDMIVISSLLIEFTLKAFNLNKMRVSTYSLKEGALIDFINKNA